MYSQYLYCTSTVSKFFFFSLYYSTFYYPMPIFSNYSCCKTKYVRSSIGHHKILLSTRSTIVQ